MRYFGFDFEEYIVAIKIVGDRFEVALIEPNLTEKGLELVKRLKIKTKEVCFKDTPLSEPQEYKDIGNIYDSVSTSPISHMHLGREDNHYYLKSYSESGLLWFTRRSSELEIYISQNTKYMHQLSSTGYACPNTLGLKSNSKSTFLSNNNKYHFLPSNHVINFTKYSYSYPPSPSIELMDSISPKSGLISHRKDDFLKYLSNKSKEFIDSIESNAKVISLVSGVDSFLPDLLLRNRAEPYHYIKGNPVGILQSYIVRVFCLHNDRNVKIIDDKLSDDVLKKNFNKFRESAKYDPLIQNSQDFRERYHVLKNDLSLTYASHEFNKGKPIYLVAGNAVSPYQSFNGTMQRDYPFITGYFRGIIRRSLLGKTSINIAYRFLQIFNCEIDALIRIFMIYTTNPLSKKKHFDLRIPNFKFLFINLDITKEPLIRDAFHYAGNVIEYNQNKKNNFSNAMILLSLARIAMIAREHMRDLMYWPKGVRRTDLYMDYIGSRYTNPALVPFLDCISPKSVVYRSLKMLTDVPFRNYINATYKCANPFSKSCIKYYYGHVQFTRKIKRLINRFPSESNKLFIF